jgi:hypothetical protein
VAVKAEVVATTEENILPVKNKTKAKIVNKTEKVASSEKIISPVNEKKAESKIDKPKSVESVKTGKAAASSKKITSSVPVNEKETKSRIVKTVAQPVEKFPTTSVYSDDNESEKGKKENCECSGCIIS